MDWLDKLELAELHVHVGAAVSPTMMWEMAHDQGIKLPTKNYWQFEAVATMSHSRPYHDYLKIYDLLEMIQSSPEAMFTAMQTAISGAYRKNNITQIELRFNPILRNRQGERDLDHLIVFALQGLERACLKYPVKAGVILSMDRRLSLKANSAIVNKAIKYKNRGIVGIDLAGPIKNQQFKLPEIVGLVGVAKQAGLGLTVHTGEATGTEEMWQVVTKLKPNRIGHGIACVKDKRLMRLLKENKIVLETCPTSNLNTQVVKNYRELKNIYRILKSNGVGFTINTDGPELHQVHLREEYRRLLAYKVLTKADLLRANQLSKYASFLNLR